MIKSKIITIVGTVTVSTIVVSVFVWGISKAVVKVQSQGLTNIPDVRVVLVISPTPTPAVLAIPTKQKKRLLINRPTIITPTVGYSRDNQEEENKVIEEEQKHLKKDFEDEKDNDLIEYKSSRDNTSN